MLAFLLSLIGGLYSATAIVASEESEQSDIVTDTDGDVIDGGDNRTDRDDDDVTDGGDNRTDHDDEDDTTDSGDDNTGHDGDVMTDGSDDNRGHDDDDMTDGGDDNTGHDDDDMTDGSDDNTGHDGDEMTDGGHDNTGHDDDEMTDGGHDNTGHDDDEMTDGSDDNTGHDEDDTTDSGDDNTGHDDDDMTDGGHNNTGHDEDMTDGGDEHTGHHEDMTDSGDVHTGHDGDDSVTGGEGDGDILLPTTEAEIEAFVANVRASEDTDGDSAHVHTTTEMTAEHANLLDLVPTESATHIAIGNGSWFDPDNWHNGEVPDADSAVVIPEGVHIEYDEVSDVEIFTLRVDGQIDFATDTDSQIIVDTFIVTPTGTMTAGTAETPVEEGVSVDIVFSGGEIDVEWDPSLISRGFISQGETKIFGDTTDAHEKTIENPMAGDTSITFDGLPEGWSVGDKIVIAGTHYDGYDWDNSVRETVYFGTQDEVRYISHIEGDVVHFDEPLEYHHDTPADDLQASVANYSRSVTFSSQDGDEAELFERGHVMLMHSNDADIRYAAFEDLGRTDKSVDLHGTNDTEGDAIDFDSNVAGRYSLHIHRTGLEDQDDPTILEGNAVFGSPGWGIVHHDSHAIIEGNATFDTFGAGYVAETGNETGSWVDNIAINAQGQSWGLAKNDNDGPNFGTSGDGFWFSGRLVDASDNIAASVNHGFIYFHRVAGKESFDADYFDFAEALGYVDDVTPTQTPILLFEDNEAYASHLGLTVVKADPAQNHDIHSVIDGFTTWNVDTGAFLEYTSHYLISDFRAIGEADGETGIALGNNVYGIVVADAEISNFENGIDLHKKWTTNINADDEQSHFYTVVDADLFDNVNDYINVTEEDAIYLDEIEANTAPSLDLDDLQYINNWQIGRGITISGTKTDSLGTHDFPSGPETFSLGEDEVRGLLEENGYYTTEDGFHYMIMNVYFTDGLTGDVYAQPELVKFNPPILGEGSGSRFETATFNGNVTIEELEAATVDNVSLVRTAESEDARTVEDFASLSDMDGETLMAMLSTDEVLSEEMAHDSHDMMEDLEL